MVDPLRRNDFIYGAVVTPFDEVLERIHVSVLWRCREQNNLSPVSIMLRPDLRS